MKEALDKVISWILVSSNDPQEVSLTVKGALTGAIPIIMIAAGVAHLNLGQDTLTATFDATAAALQTALAAVAAGVTLYGAARKLWLTVFQPAPKA